jgi:hypothetical protein
MLARDLGVEFGQLALLGSNLLIELCRLRRQSFRLGDLTLKARKLALP